MHKTFMLGTALLLAACSKTAETTASDAMATEDAATPAVRGTTAAAPGVAFKFAYQFQLPADRIMRAQEAHAQACEALGLARCRVTGMHYGLDPSGEVEAALDLRLDPAIARNFGSEGAAIVTRAGGKLASVDFDGTDAGGAITAIDSMNQRQRADLARLEQRLAALPPRARERESLNDQIEALRAQIGENAASRAVQVRSLAQTPVHFDYATTATVGGFDRSSPIANAIELGRTSFMAAITLVAVVVAGGLPWAVIALAAWFLWRRFRPRPAAV